MEVFNLLKSYRDCGNHDFVPVHIIRDDLLFRKHGVDRLWGILADAERFKEVDGKLLWVMNKNGRWSTFRGYRLSDDLWRRLK